MGTGGRSDAAAILSSSGRPCRAFEPSCCKRSKPEQAYNSSGMPLHPMKLQRAHELADRVFEQFRGCLDSYVSSEGEDWHPKVCCV